MRKLLIITTSIVLAIVAIIGGFWGYVLHSAQQQVQHLITVLQPLADVSQRGVQVLPSGVVRVQDIKIIPHTISDVISIDNIELKTANLLALFNVRRALSQGKLPETLELILRGVSLPLHGAIMGTKPPPNYQPMPFEHLSALGCGPVTYFAGEQWQDMGYERFSSDLRISYRLGAEHLTIALSSHTPGWSNFTFDLELALSAPLTSMNQLGSTVTLKLVSLTLGMEDAGYNQHRNNFCATQAGKDVNAYLAEHARLVLERLRNHGIMLGAGLSETYQSYLLGNGTLTVSLKPPIPIQPSELLDYRGADALTLAGLSVSFNHQPVSDISIDWNLAQAGSAVGMGMKRPSVEPEHVPPPPPPKPVAPTVRKDFKSIRVSALGQYLGSVARLKTVAGVEYQGVLESLGEGMMRITIRKAGGSVTLSLRTEDIAEAYIFE